MKRTPILIALALLPCVSSSACSSGAGAERQRAASGRYRPYDLEGLASGGLFGPVMQTSMLAGSGPAL